MPPAACGPIFCSGFTITPPNQYTRNKSRIPVIQVYAAPQRNQ